MNDFVERYAEIMLKVFVVLLVAASAVLFGIIESEYAEAKTRVYATCEVAIEDPVWIYDTHKITVENFEQHHVGEYYDGKKFKVYQTRNGMGRIKFHGKKAWIGTKNIKVIKKGWIKIEGKWKLVKPGFDFWSYIMHGE